jgi:hypothetical protein
MVSCRQALSVGRRPHRPIAAADEAAGHALAFDAGLAHQLAPVGFNRMAWSNQVRSTGDAVHPALNIVYI